MYYLFVPVVLSIWSLFCRHLRLLPKGQTNQSFRLDTHLHSVLNLKDSLDKCGGFEVGMKNKFMFFFSGWNLCRLVRSQAVCCYHIHQSLEAYIWLSAAS
jgi:hypothetical protein